MILQSHTRAPNSEGHKDFNIQVYLKKKALSIEVAVAGIRIGNKMAKVQK